MITGIIGGLGYGKTLLATYLACKLAEKGVKVYANYTIKHKNIEYLSPDIFLSLANDKKQEQFLIVLDEAYAWLEARRSVSTVNIALSRVILQSRKLHFDIIHTAQLPSTVDLRLRRVTQTWIWALRPDNEGFNYIIVAQPPCQFKLKYSEALKYMPLYDTYSTVEGIDVLKTDMEIIEEVAQGLRKTKKLLEQTGLSQLYDTRLEKKFQAKLKKVIPDLFSTYNNILDQVGL